MKLKVLLKEIQGIVCKGSKEVEINGICSNSKYVAPGNLFIAKRGRHEDGNHYILEAISAGASAIVTDIYNPFLGKISQVIHPEPAQIEGCLAARFYHHPSKELLLVGITGTNGKTTCSFLAKHLLDHLDKPCGVIGTIEYVIGQHRYPSTHTTPEGITSQRLLREMVLNGCKSGAMEVSSHALHQDRVASIAFDYAIFTNLSLDHLDYHGTMMEYALAKSKLFSSLQASGNKPAKAIINADSTWSKIILEQCTAPVISYGILSAADVMAKNIVLTNRYSHFDVVYKGQTVPFSWKAIGRFNISNCLAITALGLSLGVSLEKIASIISTFSPAAGRLEEVPNERGYYIYIDYAHTPDALENVLVCLNEVKTGKMITVFGCGGNRDRSKRPLMAQVAEKLSDHVIVTSDNPRDEDPQVICDEIIAGFSNNAYLVELDRRKAIEMAVNLAEKGDIILIAGKGHEHYQICSHKTIEFDDRQVAADICTS